jgi:hypothetical protein
MVPLSTAAISLDLSLAKPSSIDGPYVEPPCTTRLKREVLAWELFPTTKAKISEVMVASCHKK